MQVGGGSAVVLATQKASSDLPNCLPPNLSPLPVSVHTHSLNLYKPNLAPTYFFVFIFVFYFPTINRPRTPFTVFVRLTYRLLAYSQPLRSFPGGE